eukprot:5234316-Pleurochrysis_carterae.AAC.12
MVEHCKGLCASHAWSNHAYASSAVACGWPPGGARSHRTRYSPRDRDERESGRGAGPTTRAALIRQATTDTARRWPDATARITT